MMRGQHMRQLPKKVPEKAGGGGGMTKEDKKKLEDAVASVEKIEESFRMLNTTIHNLGVESIRDELKKLPEKATIQKVD